MMTMSPLLEQLIQSLRALPGVGPKSAQRMAFHLLQRNRQGGTLLAQRLATAMADIGHCSRCRNFTEQSLCVLCADPLRAQCQQLCIVESAADIQAIEQTGQYAGRYFVLMGRLSPLDGIGPKEIGLDQLEQCLRSDPPQELILATNPTVEGEATAYYIAEIAHRYQITVSRIAHGVPVGGELELVDGMTLSHALIGRQRLG